MRPRFQRNELRMWFGRTCPQTPYLACFMCLYTSTASTSSLATGHDSTENCFLPACYVRIVLIFQTCLLSLKILVMPMHSDLASLRSLLTCAHKCCWVRDPPPICSTHSCHPHTGNKSWVTSEEYLHTLSCVLVWLNEAIPRGSRVTTVGWRRGGRIHDTVTGNHGIPRLELSPCNQPLHVCSILITCWDTFIGT